jgi:hypothetical protein
MSVYRPAVNAPPVEASERGTIMSDSAEANGISLDHSWVGAGGLTRLLVIGECR